MSLLGSLDDIKLGDVLRMLSRGRKSGRLIATSDDAQSLLAFQGGALLHAHGAQRELEGEAAVLDLFGWPEGQLTFVAEERPVAANVRRSVEELIADGERQGPLLRRMRAVLPDDRVVCQMALPRDGVAVLELSARSFRILRLVDGIRNVAEIADALRLSRLEVRQALFAWIEAGYLEPTAARLSLRAVAHGLFGREGAELDTRHFEAWRQNPRFEHGVFRVEVRSAAGKGVSLRAGFRAGLIRDVHLPRGVLSDIGVREGEDVDVRPTA